MFSMCYAFLLLLEFVFHMDIKYKVCSCHYFMEKRKTMKCYLKNILLLI